jgi:membrane-bound lytic murein transglycosylase MltF
MLAAQGYQESMLDQNRSSHRGAVGIMQVIPKYAAAPPISIPSVSDADNNIHAGAKMLHDIQQRYFNDPGLDLTNKTLMTFAAYNAGPSRISPLRNRAKNDSIRTSGLAKDWVRSLCSTSAISINTTWRTSSRKNSRAFKRKRGRRQFSEIESINGR